jgi:hypothetical protein
VGECTITDPSMSPVLTIELESKPAISKCNREDCNQQCELLTNFLFFGITNQKKERTGGIGEITNNQKRNE